MKRGVNANTRNQKHNKWQGVNVQQDRTELFYFNATSTSLSLKRMKSKTPRASQCPRSKEEVQNHQHVLKTAESSCHCPIRSPEQDKFTPGYSLLTHHIARVGHANNTGAQDWQMTKPDKVLTQATIAGSTAHETRHPTFDTIGSTSHHD